jgi:hypothetical protein
MERTALRRRSSFAFIYQLSTATAKLLRRIVQGRPCRDCLSMKCSPWRCKASAQVRNRRSAEATTCCFVTPSREGGALGGGLHRAHAILVMRRCRCIAQVKWVNPAPTTTCVNIARRMPKPDDPSESSGRETMSRDQTRNRPHRRGAAFATATSRFTAKRANDPGSVIILPTRQGATTLGSRDQSQRPKVWPKDCRCKQQGEAR